MLCLAARAIADERRVAIPHGTVELLSEQESIQPGHAIHLGLHFRLEKEWHIYWINPGDSGEPPRLEWRLPARLRAGAIEWPAPSRLPLPPFMDYGYEGEVLLPVPIENTVKPGARRRGGAGCGPEGDCLSRGLHPGQGAALLVAAGAG